MKFSNNNKYESPTISDPIAEVRRLDLRRRIQASGYMLIFSMVISSTIATIALLRSDLTQAGTMYGVAVIILLTYIGINIVGFSSKIPRLVGILLTVQYFYLLLFGGVNNTGLMWAVMLVPGFISLYGHKWGTIALLGIGSGTVLILTFPNFIGLVAEYDSVYRARFMIVFSVLTILTAILDSSRYQTQQMLHVITAELENHASTDALTGLANRREAYRAINELEHCNRDSSACYTILIGDLDSFKVINDTFGHNFGDRVLQDVAEVLRQNTRTDDIIARWGGEEFLILLPNTDIKGGHVLAEKLCKKVEALSKHYDNGVKISISFGVTEGDSSSSSHSQLLAEADARMYRAKDGGRNRVIAV